MPISLIVPLIHDHDLIGRQDRGEPVGDGDHRSSGGEGFERLLDLLFRFGIERRGRFVEQEDRRIFQEGARDGQALLLATGEQTALVADDGLVTLRLGHDEIVRKRGPGGLVHLFPGGVEPAELNVFKNGVVKQKCFLRHEPDLFRGVTAGSGCGDRGHRR